MLLALAATLALLTACISTPSRMAAADTLCRPADQSAALIVHLREMVTTTDSLMAFARDNYFHIPVVAPGQINAVTDPRLCELASAAYGPPTGSASRRRVNVVKLGSKGFAVLDPDHLAGDKQTVIIFSPTWVRIGGWTGP